MKNVSELKKELDEIDSLPEKIKYAAQAYAEASAYTIHFKDSGRDELLSIEGTVVAQAWTKAEKMYSEKTLERKARTSKTFGKASKKYKEMLQMKEFLKIYIQGIQMEHEAWEVSQRRVTAEIKKGIYDTGR